MSTPSNKIRNIKQIFPMNAIKLTVLALGLTMSGGVVPAARAAEVSDNIYNYLQLVRSDLNSAKVEIVNSVMKLSAEEAKKFWPIYREYEQELGKQAVDRAELIAEFAQAHQDGSFDNAKAKTIAKRWFKTQRARLDLLEKYHGKIEKALTAVQAGQFLQIENQIGLCIDLTIASEMPTVGTKAK